MKHKYHNAADLVGRLCYAADRKDRAVTFLVGSAVSLPDHLGGHGVPGVSAIIDLIRAEFQGTDAETEFDNSIKNHSDNPYQIAFEFLHGRRGQDMVNRIVQPAVWNALDASNWPSSLPTTSPHDANPAICKALDDDAAAWTLPRAADLLGGLLVNYADTFGGAILTTNFDPLIEISVSKHNGRYYRTVLHEDGNLGQTVAEGTHVVHLHGYWHGYDTLHTPPQLAQARPQLRHSLAHVVESSTLVVIGYGGWDDVIAHTLADLLSDSSSTPEILRAFHPGDTTEIEDSNTRLLRTLAPGIGRGRVTLYQGIDCCSVLSDIHTQLKPSYPAATAAAAESGVITIVTEDSSRGARPRQVRIEIGIPMPQRAAAGSDSPLIVTPWIGRVLELDILSTCTAPGFLDTRLRYAAWRSSYCWRASSGVRYASFSRRQHWL